jgi:hypothetical protein
MLATKYIKFMPKCQLFTSKLVSNRFSSSQDGDPLKSREKAFENLYFSEEESNLFSFEKLTAKKRGS